MSTIAIITARGGSKRIPQKNIKNFCGKPILAYSIEAALSSGAFDEVMVSTDSEEIAEIARKYGAQVPFFRSEATSNDYAVTADVLEEVLREYEKRGKVFDSFCCVYPTAPFVTAQKLKAAADAMTQMDADSLMTVVRYGFPPQRAMRLENGALAYLQPEHMNTRSQDLEPIYHDAGQFYFCKTASFLAAHKLVMGKTVPLILPEEEVQDIDTMSDWVIAEMKYQLMLQKDEVEA